MKTVERRRYRDKKVFQIRTLEYEPFPMTEIESVMKCIASNLEPKMVTKKYREENASNPMFGHCYHSSQALFHLMDTDVLEQRTAIDYHDCSHWWLVDKTTEKIYDITADQYYHVGQTPPYAKGVKKPWYGWQQRPHQRTLNLMIKVLGKENVLDKIENI
tara:strand:- start:220 stop:699 length:480 start_codon:yes stop_codon:yes gene_type:complete